MYTQLILRHFFKMSKQIYGRLIEHNVNCTVHTVYKDVCHVSVFRLCATLIHLTQYLFLTSLPLSATMCPPGGFGLSLLGLSCGMSISITDQIL